MATSTARPTFYDRGATFSDDAAKEAVYGWSPRAPTSSTHRRRSRRRLGPTVDADEETLTRGKVHRMGARGHPDQCISVDTWRARWPNRPSRRRRHHQRHLGRRPGLPEVAAEFGAGLVCSHTGGAVPRTRLFRQLRHRRDRGGRRRCRRSDHRRRACRRRWRPPRRHPDRPYARLRQNTFHGLTLLRHVPDPSPPAGGSDGAEQQGFHRGDSRRGPDRTPRGAPLAATALAAADGARMFRVHEVGPTGGCWRWWPDQRGDRPPARTVRGLA